MSRLLLTVDGPDFVVDLTARALAESSQVTVTPESIFPGYVLDVVDYTQVPSDITRIVAEPGNGTRYQIIFSVAHSFVALPDFGKAATMSPHPGDWGYVAEKLDLNRPDAEAVFAALQGVLV